MSFAFPNAEGALEDSQGNLYDGKAASEEI